LRLSANDRPEHRASPISDLFAQAYRDDPLPNTILDTMRPGNSVKDITVPECTEQGGKEWYRGKRYVPKGDQLRLRLIQEHNDTILAGHPGRTKTFHLLDRQYYWKDMRKQGDQYVRNFHSWRRSKPLSHETFGVLRPLPVPEKR
jgi:hypothetical protein